MKTSQATVRRSSNGVHVFDLLEGSGIPDVRRLYNMLLKESSSSDSLREGSFMAMLLSLCSAVQGGCGHQLHGFCLKCGFDLNVNVGSSLLDMYTRYGLMDGAQLVFDALENRNDVSWNVLIAGHARSCGTEKALELFQRMLREGFRPSHFSYSSIFGACSSTGFLEQGKWVHAYMIKSGEKLAAFAGNSLIDMYAKSGSIQDARKILLKSSVVNRERTDMPRSVDYSTFVKIGVIRLELVEAVHNNT